MVVDLPVASRRLIVQVDYAGKPVGVRLFPSPPHVQYYPHRRIFGLAGDRVAVAKQELFTG